MDEYIRFSQKYGLPMHPGTARFVVSRDDAAFARNMAKAARLQSTFRNIMVRTYQADGHFVTDEEVVDCYRRVWEIGERVEIKLAFEMHAATRSMDFRRVVPLAQEVPGAVSLLSVQAFAPHIVI